MRSCLYRDELLLLRCVDRQCYPRAAVGFRSYNAQTWMGRADLGRYGTLDCLGTRALDEHVCQIVIECIVELVVRVPRDEDVLAVHIVVVIEHMTIFGIAMCLPSNSWVGACHPCKVNISASTPQRMLTGNRILRLLYKLREDIFAYLVGDDSFNRL